MMSAGGGGGKNIEADGDEKFVQVLDIHQPSRGLTAWPPITQMPIANGYTTHKGLPFPSLHSQFLTYNNNTQHRTVCVCVCSDTDGSLITVAQRSPCIPTALVPNGRTRKESHNQTA